MSVPAHSELLLLEPKAFLGGVVWIISTRSWRSHLQMEQSTKTYRRLVCITVWFWQWLIYVFQIMLFVVHQLFDQDTDPTGYLLLRCFRSYIELDMYAALEVHTESTIAAGEKELLKFSSLLTVILLQCVLLNRGSHQSLFRSMWTWPKATHYQRIGTFPRSTCWSIFLRISRRKALLGITTQNRMRNSMALSKNRTGCAPTLKM